MSEPVIRRRAHRAHPKGGPGRYESPSAVKGMGTVHKIENYKGGVVCIRCRRTAWRTYLLEQQPCQREGEQ